MEHITINNDEYGVYTVRDKLSSSYGGILVFENDSIARRKFRKLVLKEDFGADYELYRVGTWNVNGTLTAYKGPELLAYGNLIIDAEKQKKEMIKDE